MKLQGKGILQQPQPHFEAFKALFSHGVLGLSLTGRPIWVMKVGRLLIGNLGSTDHCILKNSPERAVLAKFAILRHGLVG